MPTKGFYLKKRGLALKPFISHAARPHTIQIRRRRIIIGDGQGFSAGLCLNSAGAVGYAMSAKVEKLSSAQPMQGRAASRSRHVLVLAVLCNVFVLVAYVWLISIGTWTKWPTLTTYYDQLATAFRHGSLSLEAKPDPALLALADPYDPASRKGIPFPTDFSLYQGKFYLYFGPTPGLILAIAKTFWAGAIGDQYLVFAFVYGIFLVQSLFIVKIWRRFFPDISPWIVGSSILVAGLISPFGWMLGIPTIYNAAIYGGQFFFLAGLYTAFDALDGTAITRWKCLLIGFFWAAALGTRITQVLPIAFMMILLLAKMLWTDRQAGVLSKSLRPWFATALTLGLGAAVIGWYNFARFGSAFETGFRYALAAVYFQAYGEKIWSTVYVLQNLHNYLLNPPLLRFAFPYFRPTKGLAKSIAAFIPLPKLYSSQQITGLLYSAPFILFAIVPVIRVFRRAARSIEGNHQRSFTWCIAALLGSLLSAVVFPLVFFWASERYMGDFVPTLLLLSIIGFWQLSYSIPSKSFIDLLYSFLAASLIIISITVSSLLALAINSNGFRQLNPVLWRQLSNLFRP